MGKQPDFSSATSGTDPTSVNHSHPRKSKRIASIRVTSMLLDIQYCIKKKNYTKIVFFSFQINCNIIVIFSFNYPKKSIKLGFLSQYIIVGINLYNTNSIFFLFTHELLYCESKFISSISTVHFILRDGSIYSCLYFGPLNSNSVK